MKTKGRNDLIEGAGTKAEFCRVAVFEVDPLRHTFEAGILDRRFLCVVAELLLAPDIDSGDIAQGDLACGEDGEQAAAATDIEDTFFSNPAHVFEHLPCQAELSGSAGPEHDAGDEDQKHTNPETEGEDKFRPDFDATAERHELRQACRNKYRANHGEGAYPFWLIDAVFDCSHECSN